MELSTGLHRGSERPQRRRHRRICQNGRDAHGRTVRVFRADRPHQPRDSLLPRLFEERHVAGRLLHQQPLLVERRRQVLRGKPHHAHGDPVAQDHRPAHEGVPGRRGQREPAQPQLPARLGRHRRLYRPAGHPQGCLGRRLEKCLQGQHHRRVDPRLRRDRHALYDPSGVHRVRPVRALHLCRADKHHAHQV